MASLQVQELEEEFGPPIEYGINQQIEANNDGLSAVNAKMKQTEQMQQDLLRIAHEQQELLDQAEAGYGATAHQVEDNLDAVKQIRHTKNAGRRKKIGIVSLLVMMVVVVAIIAALFIAAKLGLFAAFA